MIIADFILTAISVYCMLKLIMAAFKDIFSVYKHRQVDGCLF